VKSKVAKVKKILERWWEKVAGWLISVVGTAQQSQRLSKDKSTIECYQTTYSFLLYNFGRDDFELLSN
jgi:hypothetical protein